MAAMELHREVAGDGPVVLLTHGFGASSHMFASTIGALAAGYTAIAWDMRGHGRTEVSDDASDYSVAASLSDMARLLDEAGADRAVLLGHSLGGYLALEYALAHPAQVAALVLVDTGPGFRSDRRRAEWNDMTDRYAAALEEQGLDGLPGSEELRRSVHRGGATGLAHTARSTLRQEDGHVIEQLATIDVPVLVVVGSRDEPFLAGSEYMATTMPQAELVVIEGSGHAPSVTHPAEFEAALLAFLDRLTVVRSPA
jgi:pimeloyl-ACP methyl ester carboxylesterase